MNTSDLEKDRVFLDKRFGISQKLSSVFVWIVSFRVAQLSLLIFRGISNIYLKAHKAKANFMHITA